MFRANLLKRFISHRSQYGTLLQNCKRANYLHLSQCASNIKLSNDKEFRLTSKTKQYRKHDIDIRENLTETPDLNEKDFLVRLKNDPDKFGSSNENEIQIVDEGDLREEKYFTDQPILSQKLRTKQYADIIKELIRDRKIKEAIDVVEMRMLKEDRVKPEAYIYNLLLGACGRVGYTKKAFMLYNEMKRRGLNIMGGTYTALFNACANSPWPITDGLTRAKHLHSIIIEKGYEPNETNYNVMIKAFGRCGDLPMAFTLVDEMYSKKIRIRDDTINFLLQACISDKDAGFRHALLVWRKLVNKKIKPSIFTYNLMLRCIRDCGLGNLEVTQDVINRILSSTNDAKNKLLEDSNKLLLLPSGDSPEMNKNSDNKFNAPTDNNESSILKDDNDTNNGTEESPKELQLTIPNELKKIDLRPDLMADTPHLGNLISLSEITKPEERLLLVGGCQVFLKNMEQHHCMPDIKTFTQLLDCIPSTEAAEKELLSAMKKLKVKPDIDFYNMLIKKRSFRFDYESAKEVLDFMRKRKLRPNLMTYGVLALGCKTKEEGLELINEMKEKSYSLNAEILGAMLRQACHHQNISYVHEIMEICAKENVQPNKIFMENLEQFKKTCRKLLNAKQFTRSEEKAFFTFKARYKTWLEEVKVDDSEDAHPWQQYRQTNEGGTKYKWKDATSRFKAKHKSLFKVKTLKVKNSSKTSKIKWRSR